VVQAVVLVLAVIYVGLTMLADMLNAVLDPRLARMKRGWRNIGHLGGRVIVGIAAFCALSAPLLVPHDPFAQDLGKRLLVPFWMDGSDPSHLLGTDQLGRDYLARLIYGCRISMMIGVTVTIVSGIIGITIGVLGGFLGGRVDDVGAVRRSPRGCRCRSCWWRWRWSACSAAR
jgi:ABC-type dipeptide/oligopeptide/nickel transport system permease subunit